MDIYSYSLQMKLIFYFMPIVIFLYEVSTSVFGFFGKNANKVRRRLVYGFLGAFIGYCGGGLYYSVVGVVNNGSPLNVAIGTSLATGGYFILFAMLAELKIIKKIMDLYNSNAT